MNEAPLVESLFFAALEYGNAAERAAYLDSACGDDAELRRQVEKMLNAYPKVGDFLNKPLCEQLAAAPEQSDATQEFNVSTDRKEPSLERTGGEGPGKDAAADDWPFLSSSTDLDSLGHLPKAHQASGPFKQDPGNALVATVDDPITERSGTVIGPYKLLEQIGEGGFGAVFMAEQTQPIRRKVAMKVLKPGMDTRQVVIRFEAERQALALMDHPNIARVFDGGETASGRPYFVMELVRGIPITDFCDQHSLSIRQRLKLFVDVCQAVQHAHQKGIIHRDLKPSNVMVTLHDGTPVVKVIDFGVAKATGEQLTDKTLFTHFAQMIGTPLYMSPEQAGMSGLDADTRSDIYSLGVLLYELLTGTTPFDKKQLRRASYDEIRRLIREEEPPKPSTRISTLGQTALTVSAQRQSEPRRLSRLFRGELDWIVMKALEKDRNRRYETANGLGRDVQRYLHDGPVQACPPSAWYRFCKFARRNKTPLAVTGLILLCIAAVGGSGGWLVRDRAARRREAESKVLEALKAAERRLGEGHPWDLALTWAAQRIEAELDSGVLGPEVRRRAEQLLRDVRMLADLDEIRLRQADSSEGALFDHAGTARRYTAAFARYGLELADLEPEEAVARLRSSAIHEALLAGLDAWMQVKPAQASDRSRLKAAADGADDSAWRRAFREAALTGDAQKLKTLVRQAEALAQWPSVLAWLSQLLADTARCKDLPNEFEILLRQAQLRNPGDFWINYNLGRVALFGAHPNRGEAVGYFRAAAAIRPSSAEARTVLGIALGDKGDNGEAIATLQQAVALDPKYANSHGTLGACLLGKKRLDEAIAELSKAIELDPKNAASWNNRGNAYYALCQFDKAVVDLNKAIGLDPKNAASWNNRGHAYYELREYDKALADSNKAIELDPMNAACWNNRGHAYYALRQYDKALADLNEAIKLDLKHVAAWFNRGLAYTKLHQYEKAIADLSKVVELAPKLADAWKDRGLAYTKLHQFDKALADLNKAIELDPKAADPWNWRGYIYGYYLNQSDKALADLNKAIELEPKYGSPWNNRGVVYFRIGKWDKAVADQAKALELDPMKPLLKNDLAWTLAVCPEAKLRDPNRAVELAASAVKGLPKEADIWTTLGVARYRADDWQGAAEALQNALKLFQGSRGFQRGVGRSLLFLAMAQHRLDRPQEARQTYDRARTWLETNRMILGESPWCDNELRRFRDEAASLLTVGKKSK